MLAAGWLPSALGARCWLCQPAFHFGTIRGSTHNLGSFSISWCYHNWLAAVTWHLGTRATGEHMGLAAERTRLLSWGSWQSSKVTRVT
ncbi:hypothetical protein BD289DRAFT_442474 [Coniella lustricola]|uniref:Uncharacterized protein n=1 Tax=Coniella lustricola TaxID=2025994 RepID=A0A2T2ZY53_9PEZI|nr:hypothetical protein BD289DRAFT_442474 [Coniella lustricola]